MLLAQVKEMYILCFRFGKLRDIACCPIFNLIQILLQLTFNRPCVKLANCEIRKVENRIL